MNAVSTSVTVAIPCRTYGRFLAEAIESALRQRHPVSEVLVIDADLGEETTAAAQPFGDQVRRVKVAGAPLSIARQTALELAAGEFFLNLDADDRLSPHYVERTLAVFERERDPRLAVVYTPQRCFGDATGSIPALPYDLRRLKHGNFIPMCALLRTAAAREAGFDPAFSSGWGDYDLFLGLAGRGYRAMPTDHTYFERRVHEGCITARIVRAGAAPELRRRILRKHAAMYGRLEWTLAWLETVWMSWQTRRRPPA